MIKFVEFEEISNLEVNIALELGWDILEVLKDKKKYFDLNRIGVWSELEDISSFDLFDETQRVKLIDIQNLKLDEAQMERLKRISQGTDLLLFSSQNPSLKAEDKKIWKKFGFDYSKIERPSDQILINIAQRYLDQNDYKLSSGVVNQVVKDSLSASNLIDNLDLVYLSGDEKLAAQGLHVELKPLPFMLSFSVPKLKQDAPNWLSLIQEEELQLALSLIYTKLEKQSGVKAQQLMVELISTDRLIKTRSKVDPMVWWKLFLFKSINLN